MNQDHSHDQLLDHAYSSLFESLGPFNLYGNQTTDPLLRSRREIVCQIISMVDHRENLEMSVAALRIIQEMSDSPQFDPSNSYAPHKLFTILEDAGILPKVMNSFISRLERAEEERISWFEAQLNGSEEKVNLFEYGLSNVIRLQILDFFLANCIKPGFNLAHYLLGFNPKLGVAGTSFDLQRINEKDNCLFVILDILDFGLNYQSQNTDTTPYPLVMTDHPAFAEKSYQLLFTLLKNNSTCKAVLPLVQASRFNHITLSQINCIPVDFFDISNLHLTIHELGQKTWFLQASCLDFFKTSNKTAFLEVFKSQKENFLIEHLKSLDLVLQNSFLDNIHDLEEQNLFLKVLSIYIEAIGKYLECILNLQSVPNDLKSSISSRLLACIFHFINLPNAPIVIKETLASLLLLAIKNHGKSEFDFNFLQNLLHSISSPSSSLNIRAFLYAGFIGLPPSFLTSQKTLIAKEANKVTVMAFGDIISSGPDLESWKSLAVSFVTLIASFEHQIVQFAAKEGLLKPFVQTFRLDEVSLLSFIRAQSGKLDVFYLWKSKIFLLQKLCGISINAVELLVDAGLLDNLSQFHLIDTLFNNDYQDLNGMSGKDYLYEIVELVFSVVVLISDLNTFGSKHSAVHNGILGFITAHFDLIAHCLIIKGPLHENTKQSLLLLSCELINYGGSALDVLASRHAISFRHLFINMLVKSLLSFEKEPSSVFPLEILNHAISFLFSESVIGGKSSLIDFDDLPADSLTHLGKIPLSIIDRAMAMLVKVIMSGKPLDNLGLGILEKLCLIVLNDFEKTLASHSSDITACETMRRRTMQAMSRHLEFLGKFQPDTFSNPKLAHSIKRWAREIEYNLSKHDTNNL